MYILNKVKERTSEINSTSIKASSLQNLPDSLDFCEITPDTDGRKETQNPITTVSKGLDVVSFWARSEEEFSLVWGLLLSPHPSVQMTSYVKLLIRQHPSHLKKKKCKKHYSLAECPTSCLA